ncbi:MAG TPA: DUF4190 domain-containing protein [Pirellulales bacterium]|nr:DUF4190 domain-containing protein [Pirellulales bacterium]
MSAGELRSGGTAVCARCTHHFPYQPSPDTSTTSRKAKASLVLATASLLFCCLTAVPALVLGGWALFDIHRHEGRLRGRNLALTAIVLTLLCSFLSLIVWGLLLPVIQALLSRDATTAVI